jgi:DNA-binding transcriptional LysR family regulator
MPLPVRVSDLTGFDLLLSVARTGSIGRAAAEHGVSQPAASARMRLLEGQLGLALIERSPRGSKLTPAGALVGGWAQAAVDAAASLDAGVVALRRERDSRLRIAASMTVAEYLLAAWLTALRSVDPGAVVALSAVNSADVAHAVLAGAAEIGFVEGPGIPDGLHAEPVGRDTLTLVVAPAHPWARRRAGVPAAELARTALVSREAGSGTRGYLEEALRAQAGLAWVPPAAELSSTTAIKAAVAAGAAPAVLSSLAVAAELAAGTLRAVPVTGVDLTRTLRAVWTEGRRLAGPALDLYAIAVRSAHPRGRHLLPDEPGARGLARRGRPFGRVVRPVRGPGGRHWGVNRGARRDRPRPAVLPPGRGGQRQRADVAQQRHPGQDGHRHRGGVLAAPDEDLPGAERAAECGQARRRQHREQPVPHADSPGHEQDPGADQGDAEHRVDRQHRRRGGDLGEDPGVRVGGRDLDVEVEDDAEAILDHQHDQHRYAHMP